MSNDDRKPPGFAAPRARLLACLLSTALLTACTPAEQESAADPTTPAVAPAPTVADDAVPAPATTGTVGGDGSPIQLDPLSVADIEGADLQGELACSFADADDVALLHAMGTVASQAPAQGIVNVAGNVEPVRAPGGFDGMAHDVTFTGRGKTITIARTGRSAGGGESPAHPATLTYQRADGASRAIAGQWQCGP